MRAGGGTVWDCAFVSVEDAVQRNPIGMPTALHSPGNGHRSAASGDHSGQAATGLTLRAVRRAMQQRFISASLHVMRWRPQARRGACNMQKRRAPESPSCGLDPVYTRGVDPHERWSFARCRHRDVLQLSTAASRTQPHKSLPHSGRRPLTALRRPGWPASRAQAAGPRAWQIFEACYCGEQLLRAHPVPTALTPEADRTTEPTCFNTCHL